MCVLILFSSTFHHSRKTKKIVTIFDKTDVVDGVDAHRQPSQLQKRDPEGTYSDIDQFDDRQRPGRRRNRSLIRIYMVKQICWSNGQYR